MKRAAPDWLLYFLAFTLMSVGILNLYSIEDFPAWSWKYAYVRQFTWAGISVLAMVLASLIEGQVWRYFAYTLYGLGVAVMLLTAVTAREINGARAWLSIGPLQIQPAEFMKIATALALAAYLTRYDFRWGQWRDRLMVGVLIGVPMALTLLQSDTGTALTFAAFLVPLYRWGLSIWVILIPVILGGLAFMTLLYPWVYIASILTVLLALVYFFILKRRYLSLHIALAVLLWVWLGFSGYLYHEVLAPHQRQRIEVLLDPYKDPLGSGWNTIQARVALVAGGLTGQGYGKGLQSKLDFIPQRHTDFAYCSIAEEWGWLGGVVVISLYLFFLLRIAWVAESTNNRFALLYGYALSALLWIHLLINVAMIVGLLPVVGIPLIFISYGGSSWVAIGWGLGILQSFYRERWMRLFG
ncbi:MAG: rod shape-determining protein RodA [Bacteroidia bacterium]|nr:rod shape-determining protein RodA [Bacteroidia bacterium]